MTLQVKMISASLKLLERYGTLTEYERAKALIGIAVTMRHPESSVLQAFASDLTFLDYYSRTSRHGDVGQPYQSELNMRGFLDKLVLPESFDAVYYNNFDDERLIANVARFLLAYKNPTNDKRNNPGIQKAYHFLCKNEQWRTDFTAYRSFLGKWSERGNLFAFYYVNEFVLNRVFSFGAYDLDLVRKLDKLMADASIINRFLSQTKFVQSTIVKILSPPARKALKLPKLPDFIVEAAVNLPKADASMAAIMETYEKPL